MTTTLHPLLHTRVCDFSVLLFTLFVPTGHYTLSELEPIETKNERDLCIKQAPDWLPETLQNALISTFSSLIY